MKKKTLLCVLTVFLIGGLSYGEVIDSAPFAPVTPEVIGQGGSFTAVAHGYNSLFTNPAGFARAGGSFTLLSATASPYFFPRKEVMDEIDQLSQENTDDLDAIDAMIRENGVGADANAGVALVGKGLGIGIVGNVDVYGRGETLLGTTVDVVRDWAVIGGYAVPLNLGPVVLNVGGDLRYMMRAEIPDLKVGDFLDETAEEPTFELYTGGGLGLDFGVIAEMGPWSLGFSLRDIGGTSLDYRVMTDATMDDMQSILGFEAVGDPVTDEYVVPMVSSYGLGYDPDGFLLPAFLFDPVFHLEYRHTHYQAADAEEYSFWTGVHMGMEARVLRFIKLRGGINQGYVTAGMGVKLLFLDINASYFVREMGRYAGVKPNEGFTVEAAIRF
jgi:hypothetical protein